MSRTTIVWTLGDWMREVNYSKAYLKMKGISSRQVAIVLAVILSVIILLYMILSTTGHRPTCISLNFSLPNKDIQEIDGLVLGFTRSRNLVETEQSVPFGRRAFNEHVFVKWDAALFGGNRATSALMVCRQERGNIDYWQRATTDLEGILRRRYQDEVALLQRGDGYSCDRSCDFFPCKNPCSISIASPVDFDRLESINGK
jgi:hypothetical protein